MQIDQAERSGGERSRVPGAVLGACSLILPGAGQMLARRWVRGVLMLLVATAAGIGLIAYLRDQSLGSLAGDIVRREVLIGIFAANGAVFLLRAVCIVDAYRLGRRGSRVLQAGVLAALLALAAVPHAAVAYIDWDSYRTLSAVFPEEEPAEADAAVPFAPDSAYETKQPAAAVTFEDTKGPIETGPTISETASARSSAAAFGTPLAALGTTASRELLAAPWERSGRLTVLLLGGDRGPGRSGIRTDTMIVLSVNVKTRNAVLFSLPRNMWGVPLPPAAAARFGDTYDNLLNSLYPFALAHPEAFRGGRDPGATALKQVIANLLGIRIDYYALVDFAGFVDVIDALGGVDMNIPTAVLDRVSPATPGGEWIPHRPEAGLPAPDGAADVRLRARPQPDERLRPHRPPAPRARRGRRPRQRPHAAAQLPPPGRDDAPQRGHRHLAAVAAGHHRADGEDEHAPARAHRLHAADLHARGQPPGRPAHPRDA